MKVEPRKEHEWLQQLVGEWTYGTQSCMGLDQPPMKFTGTEVVRTLGGVWVLCEGEGEMPGGDMGRTIMTLGFDPRRNKFIGTYIGSMMDFLWVYEGELDGSGEVLTLDTLGPSFEVEGTMTRYQDIIERKSADHRLLISRMQGKDGQWTKIMEAEYRRKK